MKIVIGCDHAGYEIKQSVKKAILLTFLSQDPDTKFLDVGCDSTDSVHYPEYGKTVAVEVAFNDADYGILICLLYTSDAADE